MWADKTGAVIAEWAGGADGWSLGGARCSPSLLSPQYGKKKLKYLPYNHQHEYFFLSECWGPLSNHSLEHLPPLRTPRSPLSLVEQEGLQQPSKQTAPGPWDRRDTEAWGPTLRGPWVGRVGGICFQPLLRHRSLPLPVSYRAGPPTSLSASALPTVGPPLLIPVYFQYQIIMTMIVRRDWVVSQGVQLAWAIGNPWGQGWVGPAASQRGCLITLRKGVPLGLPGAREATALHIPPPTHIQWGQ